MPPDSVWKDSPFAGQTCEGLKEIVPDNDHDGIEMLCNFLSQGIYSGPTVLDACCFCGGGEHVIPLCENLEWNSMRDSGIELNCEFIDKHIQDKAEFCNKYGAATFAQDRLTVKEAVSFVNVFFYKHLALRTNRKVFANVFKVLCL